jgi:cell division protein ZapA
MSNETVGRVRVVIHGSEYMLRSSKDSPEHLRTLANLVDRKMNEISNAGNLMDERRIAVLAALNLAEELVKLKSEYEDLLSLLDENTKRKE